MNINHAVVLVTRMRKKELDQITRKIQMGNQAQRTSLRDEKKENF